jgi:hypothetical protein
VRRAVKGIDRVITLNSQFQKGKGYYYLSWLNAPLKVLGYAVTLQDLRIKALPPFRQLETRRRA